MSVALYIVLEKQVVGFDHHVSGNALGRAGKLLDVLAEKAGTKPLMQFFSASPRELAEFAASHGGANEERPAAFPPECWFSAEDGLLTVRALREAARNARIQNWEKVVSDLDEFERILNGAKDRGVGSHLAVDF